MLNPKDILTVEDYEKPRTLDELSAWRRAKWELFHATKEGRAYAREGTGLSKKFHEEADPMLVHMRRFPPPAGIRCQLLSGNQRADCVYLDVSGAAIREFQVTTATDGRTEKLRLRQLSRAGHVDGLAKLNDDDEIPDDALPSDRWRLIEERAASVMSAINNKNRKGYGADFTLIVGFDDNTFDTEEDARLFRQCIGNPQHAFAELHIVGVLGNIAIP